MPTNTFSRSLKGRILLTLPYYGFVLISFLIDRLFFHVVDPFNLLVVLGTAVALNVVICWVPLPQYVTVFIFLLFAQYGGMMLNLYDNVSWYDVVVHLGSGVMLVYIGQYLYSLILRRRRGEDLPLILPVAFSFFFSTACAGLWEIYEFFADHVLGLDSQLGSLDDTMWDIIAGTCGAVIAAATLFWLLKRRRQKAVPES